MPLLEFQGIPSHAIPCLHFANPCVCTAYKHHRSVFIRAALRNTCGHATIYANTRLLKSIQVPSLFYGSGPSFTTSLRHSVASLKVKDPRGLETRASGHGAHGETRDTSKFTMEYVGCFRKFKRAAREFSDLGFFRHVTRPCDSIRDSFTANKVIAVFVRFDRSYYSRCNRKETVLRLD